MMISRRDTSIPEDDSLVQSKELSLVRSYPEEAPFEEFCGHIVMGSETPSVGHIDPIYTEPVDLTPTSSPLLPPLLRKIMHFMGL